MSSEDIMYIQTVNINVYVHTDGQTVICSGRVKPKKIISSFWEKSVGRGGGVVVVVGGVGVGVLAVAGDRGRTAVVLARRQAT